MKRLPLLSAPTLLLLTLACVASAAPAKDTWLSVRTKNFLLVGNADADKISQVGVRLEQFRAGLLQLFPQAALSVSAPTTVVVFKDDAAYQPFKPLYQGKPQTHVAGYFQAGEDVNYITVNIERREAENPFGLIFHEYTHLLMRHLMRGAPVWFNEGVAEYYSTFALTDGDKRIALGRPLANHVRRLRQQFMPLADLLRVTHDAPAYNEREQSDLFYAESWALVHYLWQDDKGARASQLARFSELCAAGRTLEDSFRQAFGLDLATMELALRRYVQHNSYRVQYLAAARPLAFDAALETRLLTEAEAQAYLADLLFHTNRAAEAEARLQHALALAPDLPIAQATLGIIRVRQQRYGEAVAALQQAVAADPRNYLAHYYLAEALHRQTLGPGNIIVRYPPQLAARMRTELQQTIELNPLYADAYHLLALLDLVNEVELPAATELLLRARQLNPDEPLYGLTLAKVYIRREQFAAARDLLEQLMRSDSGDSPVRAETRVTLKLVNSYVEQVAKLKLGEAAPLPRDDERAPPDATPPLEPVKLMIKRRAEGEYVRGLLTQIECTGGASVVFYVQAAARLYKFHADALNRVRLVAYVPGRTNTFVSCGPIKPDMLVIFTYRPSRQPRALYDGEAIAADLISQDMEVEP